MIVTGSGHATGLQGHLYLSSPASVGTTHLSAETIIATVQWDEGIRTGDPSRSVATKTGQGEEREVLRDVEITLDPDGEFAELLTFSIGESPAISIDNFGHGQASYTDERMVAYAALSGDAQRAGEVDRPRFVYEIDEPTVWFDTAGQAQVNGTFSVFVNNLTLDAEEANGSTWSTWAGYREDDPGAPASTYERRVVTLEVANGTLTTAPRSPVVLFGPQVDVELDGAAVFDDVSGRLSLDDKVLLYEHSSLELDGQLDLELVATDAGDSQDTAAGALRVLPAGQFEAIHTGQDGQGGVVVSSSGSGIGSGVLVLGLLAAVGVGVLAKSGASRAAASLGSWPGFPG